MLRPAGTTAQWAVVQTSYSRHGLMPGSLHTALKALRPQGTAIDLAFYQGGADALRLGEEFHHNGLSIRCAQINRVPRGLAPSGTAADLPTPL